MALPTLSVILCNFNHGAYVGDALAAILAQAPAPFEVLVVDDASTDNSLEVIHAAIAGHDNVQLLINETNRGVVFSAERALAMAQGDFVYHAAADDRVLPGFFGAGLSMLEQHPQAGLYVTDPSYFYEASGQIETKNMQWAPGPTFLSPAEFAVRGQGAHVPGHCCLLRRSALLEAGGLLEQLRWHCDWFATLVIAFRYGVCYSPTPGAWMRLLPTSYSAAGQQKAGVQREVIGNILELICAPTYRDVREMFSRSAVLFIVYPQVIGVALRAPYVKSSVVRKLVLNLLVFVVRHRPEVVRDTVIRCLYSLAPAPLLRVYRKLRGKPGTAPR